MKKIARTAFVALCVVTLGGCALPEKPRVSSPPSTTSPDQSSPVYVQDGTDPEISGQPGNQAKGSQQQGVVEESTEVILPSAVYINDRIFEYGRKLDRWKELDSQSVNMNLKEEDTVQMVGCFRSLQNVLSAYSELRTKMIQAQELAIAAQISDEEIFELQKSDVAFLESSCGRILADSEDKSVGWNQRQEGADLNQVETLIERYAINREYEEIIQVWTKIPDSQISRIDIGTKILYGNALMYLHQEEKAAEIYQQVVNQMSNSEEQATDLVSLRKMLADLYTASGNYSSASREYKKISQDYSNLGRLEDWSKLQLSLLDRSKDSSMELKQYAEMLRDYLGFIPERDGYMIIWQTEKFQSSYPYSPVASNVEFIRDSVQQQADKWFNGFMSEVDQLASEKKYTKALRLLETMPTDIVSAEKQLAIKAKNEELLLAEAVENETGKMAKIQDLQNQWNNGLLLVKGGRYEEAISVFSELLDTEYSLKAENKIEEISLEAAKADRRKAAELFIRFTKTSELESKKKLLVESRKLLRNILIKYPEVEIAPKVRGNIKRVEQEMNAIDPNLVFMADQEMAPVVKDDGIDSAFSMPRTNMTTTEQAPIIETDLNVPPSQ